MRTIVISDIHGSFYTMKKLLDEISFNSKNDKLICLGDMCDRGKNTKLVWEFFYNLQQENPQHVVLLGNHLLLQNQEIAVDDFNTVIDEVASKGQTAMFVAIQKQVAGIIVVADTIKATSKEAIQQMKALGLQVRMVTGDHEKTAKAIANEVGIETVYSQVLPNEKASVVQQLLDEGYQVAMVGDGINDAPALAKATVGIAIGSGVDVAIETSDMVMMQDDLRLVAKTIQLSKMTMMTIKENLFWAFIYNVIGIPVAMGVLHFFGGPLLSPMIAGAAMSFSSVSVVLNALRLNHKLSKLEK